MNSQNNISKYFFFRDNHTQILSSRCGECVGRGELCSWKVIAIYTGDLSKVVLTVAMGNC